MNESVNEAEHPPHHHVCSVAVISECVVWLCPLSIYLSVSDVYWFLLVFEYENSLPVTLGLIFFSGKYGLLHIFKQRVEVGLINVSSPAALCPLKRSSEGRGDEERERGEKERERERGEKRREENSRAMSSEFWEKSGNLVSLFRQISCVVDVKRVTVSTTFQALWSWKGQPAPACSEKQILLVDAER